MRVSVNIHHVIRIWFIKRTANDTDFKVAIKQLQRKRAQQDYLFD